MRTLASTPGCTSTWPADLGSFLKEARRAVSEQAKLLPGYSLAWSGEYEYLVRVAKRMWVVIPLTLLLYLNFKEFMRPLIVMLSLPFVLIGGLWLVYIPGYSWSVAVARRGRGGGGDRGAFGPTGHSRATPSTASACSRVAPHGSINTRPW